LQFDYPHYTPYQYAGNKPITYIDLDGAEEYKTTIKMYEATGESEMTIEKISNELFPSEQYNKPDGLGGYYYAVDWQEKNTISVISVGADGKETTISTDTKFTTKTTTGAWALFNREGWAKFKVSAGEFFNKDDKYFSNAYGIVFTSKFGQGQENRFIEDLKRVYGIINIDDLMGVFGMSGATARLKSSHPFVRFLQGISDGSTAIDAMSKFSNNNKQSEATDSCTYCRKIGTKESLEKDGYHTEIVPRK